MTTKSIQQFSNLLPRSEHQSRTAKTLDNHPIQRDTHRRRRTPSDAAAPAPGSQHAVDRVPRQRDGSASAPLPDADRPARGVSHTTSPAVLTHRAQNSQPQCPGQFATRDSAPTKSPPPSTRSLPAKAPPFDRVIVAQSARRNLTIATHDAKILTAALTPTLAL